MAYSVIKKPSDYFNTKLYTGNGSARTISGVGFQPDWVWVKDRTTTNYHYLYDAVRGNNLNLFSNDTSAEVNVTTGQNGGGIGSQASDGFNIVAGNINTNNVNTSGNLYASWNWLANGAGVANTDGSISSTVSANTTSGFSIVKYTGTSANATVGHGLSAVPKMIIVKNLDQTDDWYVYHVSRGATQHIILNSPGIGGSNATLWQNTEPTSSVFSIGTNNVVNTSGENYIAYCFAEKQGFSKFGSYTGNGSADGTFIYTGFKPAWLMIKKTNATDNWHIFDNKRDSFNMVEKNLRADLSNAEFDTGVDLDFLSNGVKLRNIDDNGNGSGETYIYMAFASEPLVGDNPATAR